jgi:hypothetical protein
MAGSQSGQRLFPPLYSVPKRLSSSQSGAETWLGVAKSALLPVIVRLFDRLLPAHRSSGVDDSISPTTPAGLCQPVRPSEPRGWGG